MLVNLQGGMISCVDSLAYQKHETSMLASTSDSYIKTEIDHYMKMDESIPKCKYVTLCSL